jgi:hypothetical protein
MARRRNGAETITVKGRKIEVGPNADLWCEDFFNVRLDGLDLHGANLWNARLYHLDEVNLAGANLDGANLLSASARSANFAGASLRYAELRRATFAAPYDGRKQTNFAGADLTGADLAHADFRFVDLTGANLTGADLTNANFNGANLQNANLTDTDTESASFVGANLEGVIRSAGRGERPTRSYGAMTGPILKIGKSDSPSKAADFKRRYPAEFERLKADTGGRDFTDSLRESLREKYRTPFDWVVTASKYKSGAQRYYKGSNEVMLLNVNIADDRYTAKQRDLLDNLASVSRRSGHPHANNPLFTIGWVRYAKDDKHRVLLIEEVQSDVEVVRTKMKGDTEDINQLRNAGINPADYAEALDLLRPYSERFYEDAIGLIYLEAEALGYTVEMLGYGDKKEFGSPRSVYTDLPKRLGMTQKRESEVPVWRELKDRVSYYKPNPAKPPRRRKR